MSAILDLDQIACSGNGVVSDKCVLPALTHLAGSLQRGALVQIDIMGEVVVLFSFTQGSSSSSWLWEAKGWLRFFLGWLVTTFSMRFILGAFCLWTAAGSGWTFAQCVFERVAIGHTFLVDAICTDKSGMLFSSDWKDACATESETVTAQSMDCVRAGQYVSFHQKDVEFLFWGACLYRSQKMCAKVHVFLIGWSGCSWYILHFVTLQ